MRANYFDEALETLSARNPFKPFTIVLVNGNRFEIDHPRALAFRGGGGAVFLAPGDVPVIFDHEGVSEIVADMMEKADE